MFIDTITDPKYLTCPIPTQIWKKY